MTPEQFSAIRDLLAIYGAAAIGCTVTLFAWLFWTPKFTECSQCANPFKLSRKERAAAVLDGDELRPLCPRCADVEDNDHTDLFTLPETVSPQPQFNRTEVMSRSLVQAPKTAPEL